MVGQTKVEFISASSSCCVNALLPVVGHQACLYESDSLRCARFDVFHPNNVTVFASSLLDNSDVACVTEWIDQRVY